MKTINPKKFHAILTFVAPVVFLYSMSLTGCSKKVNGNDPVIKDPVDSVNVKTVGAVGNGIADDTWAFNAAINKVAETGGGIVYVPQGTYLIDADVSIIMKSNVILNMIDSTRIIKVKPSSQTRYNVIRLHKITNAQVKGGKINGERYRHIGTTGEWGMGISLYEATNCKIVNTVITDCWGDGIVVGSTKNYNAPNQSRNIIISGVVSRNNRRQGLTVGGVDSLIVTNSKFTHTNGTAPQAGIDIEPDRDAAERVYIRNCEIAHNAKVGIEMNAKASTTAIIRHVTVEGNYIHRNTYSAYIQNVSHVKMYNNRLIFNDWNGVAPGGNGNVPYTVNAANSVFTPNTYQ